jgi:hypothetical protein
MLACMSLLYLADLDLWLLRVLLESLMSRLDRMGREQLGGIVRLDTRLGVMCIVMEYIPISLSLKGRQLRTRS